MYMCVCVCVCVCVCGRETEKRVIKIVCEQMKLLWV